jgi:hypothetical protein
MVRVLVEKEGGGLRTPLPAPKPSDRKDDGLYTVTGFSTLRQAASSFSNSRSSRSSFFIRGMV